MPQGSKASYSPKQKRKAAHIEASYEKRGLSTATAEARAWKTVNKQDGGAKKKTSSASKKSASKSTAKKSTKSKR